MMTHLILCIPSTLRPILLQPGFDSDVAACYFLSLSPQTFCHSNKSIKSPTKYVNEKKRQKPVRILNRRQLSRHRSMEYRGAGRGQSQQKTCFSTFPKICEYLHTLILRHKFHPWSNTLTQRHPPLKIMFADSKLLWLWKP